MKKPILNSRGMESGYSAPTLEILPVTVEHGFATIPTSWQDSSDYGYAGKDIGKDDYYDYGDF